MLIVPEIVVVLGVCLLTVTAALWWTGGKSSKPMRHHTPLQEPLIWRFDNDVLEYATLPAANLAALEPGRHRWADLRETLLSRFPDFPNRLAVEHPGQMSLCANDGTNPQQLLIEWHDSQRWVTMTQSAKNETDNGTHSELRTLQNVAKSSPNPAWQEDQSGNVTWHNCSYGSLYQTQFGDPFDPAKRLFPDPSKTGSGRVSIHNHASHKVDWYELTSVPAGNVTTLHATNINSLVEAEEARRNFVQTLAKTFAHLSIGLAIFDRKGQLSLFNPALLDLTGLPVQFLSARPTMLSFFDQLRENRRMPEPKNYLSWRQEITDVIAAATDDRFEETWSLESGLTYNIKGRPHPDGATAFLIEDISAEMSLTRNFRAELDQAHSLIDSMSDAIVVFSATGILTLCNTAYKDLWCVDPDSTFSDFTIRDCIKVWKENCAVGQKWSVFEDIVGSYGERQTAIVTIHLKDGRTLSCQVAPIPNGTTMVRFAGNIENPEKSVKLLQSGTG